MLTISCNQKNKDEVILCVTGRIDTLTAEEFGKTVSAAHAEEPEAKIILNFEKVEIISSYGLRELLQFTKQGIDYKLTNVNADVFAVLKLSGFLNYIEIEKPLKQLSLQGCEMIGKGANAEVFRLNDEQVVKIFKRAPDIDQIIRERILAKKAIMAGVPSAISFEMAEVNGEPGLIFELIKARSLAFQIAKDPSAIDEYIDGYVEITKTTHAIDAEKDVDYPLEPAVEIFRSYIDFLEEYLDGAIIAGLRRFSACLPESTMLLHGDIQPGNVMVTKQGLLFIDMDSLTKGPSVFDLGYLYRTLILFWQVGSQESFLRFNEECSRRLWDEFIQRYYADEDIETVKIQKKQIEIIGLVSICRKILKRNEKQDIISKIKKQLQDAVSEYFENNEKEQI